MIRSANGNKPAPTIRGSWGPGFTLVEVLVVVLILAILMTMAVPLFISTVSDSQKKVCRANLQTIANAVVAARVKTMATDYSDYVMTDISTAANLAKLPDLTTAPACPAGRKYNIVDGSASPAYSSFKVTCVSHGAFEPGVDNN